jgi:hypothetical protein
MLSDGESTLGHDKKIPLIWNHTTADFLIEVWICRGFVIDTGHYFLASPFRIPQGGSKINYIYANFTFISLLFNDSLNNPDYVAWNSAWWIWVDRKGSKCAIS